jgi:hypothetical protein
VQQTKLIKLSTQNKWEKTIDPGGGLSETLKKAEIIRKRLARQLTRVITLSLYFIVFLMDGSLFFG